MSQCEAAESSSQVNPQVIDGKERSALDEVLRQGARQMLVKAIEEEVIAESMSKANASVSLPRSCRRIFGARKASKNSSPGCT